MGNLRWIVATAVVVMVAATPASASFRPVGGNLNVDPANGARMSGIGAVGGVPYVALSDQVGGSGGPLRVRRLNGTSWDFVGGDVSTGPRDDPNLTSFNNQPWVTSTEFSQPDSADHVFASYFNGTSWIRDSSSLNIDSTKTAVAPDITTVKDGVIRLPYVAFGQFNGSSFEIRVRRRKSTAGGATVVWEAPGDALQGSAGWSAARPRIVSDPSDGTPYISWAAQSPPAPNPGGGTPPPPTFRFYVARGTMVTSPSSSYWTVIGGQLNQNEDSVSTPDVAVVGGEPWAVWTEKVGGIRQVRVARYSGGSWQQVGQSSLNVDPAKDVDTVRIANVGGTPYVVMNQQFESALFHDHVWVKRFDGTSWVPVGGPLNIDPALAGYLTGIADVGGVPYVAFEQETSGKSELRVSRLETPTCQASTVDVPHNALGFTISLSCDEGVRSIKTSVAHGVLSDLDGAAGTVKYTPAANYSGPDSLTFASSDGALEAAPVTVSLNVAAPPGGGGGGGDGTTPPARPSLSGLRRTHGVFAVGTSRTPLSGRTAARRRPTPRGTTFSFSLNVDATVTMAIRRVRGGRKVGRRCLAPTPARRTKPRCLRLVTVTTLTRNGRKGLNRIPFSGRIGLRALSPGSYRAVFGAANATGRSTGRTSGFTIVR